MFPNLARSNTPAGTAKHSPRANECHVPSSRKLPTIRNDARGFSYVKRTDGTDEGFVHSGILRKSLLATAYQEISWHAQGVARVVIIFDSSDCRQIALTLFSPTATQYKNLNHSHGPS